MRTALLRNDYSVSPVALLVLMINIPLLGFIFGKSIENLLQHHKINIKGQYFRV
jgi:hypothetical protein